MKMPLDLRYAARLVQRAPGFALAVMTVLALGIGATTAVFSTLDQAVLRPLPYVDPDRLALVSEDFSAFGMPKNRVSPATFFDWRRRTQTFSELAALRVSVMNFAESSAPEQVLGASATANLFSTLGVPPLTGRTFSVDDEPPGHHLVVLGYALWHRRFGADAHIIGRSILMNDQPYVVVGIMPAQFHFPDARTEFWVPIGLQPQQIAARNSHYLRVVGRLQPGVTWPQARDDMRRVAASLSQQFPASNKGIGVTVSPLHEEVTGDSGRELLLLLGAAACILLIACANVANLLLARFSGRRREIAIRVALGASQGRVVRQLLTECLVLSGIGAAAGLLVARWSLDALQHFVPPALSTSVDVHLNGRALLFAISLAALATLLFGMAPALQTASGTTRGLNVRGSAGMGRGGTRLRRSLVIGEIALALVLVVGATLLVETLVHLRHLDPGFRADHLLTAQVTVPYPKYADAGRRRAFYLEVLARVRSLPGVVAVGLTSDLPYTSQANYMGLKIENQTTTQGLGQDALFRLVSAGYLETMGARVKAGRLLNDRDSETSMPAVVVNEALARVYWPDRSPVGQRLDTGTGDGAARWMTIVGVVDDLKERGLDFSPKPAVYVPLTQTDIAFFQPSEIAVRTAGAPEDLAGALQRTVWAVDSGQPVTSLRTMEEIVDVELGGRQRMLSLLGVFASLAFALALLGIYSVVSNVVSERRREIGVRLAIGASARDVTNLILTESMLLVGYGLAVGLAGSVVATRWLGSLLAGVSPLDPMVLGGVSVAVAMVSLMAAFIPARRAARLDPLLVLRMD